MPETQRTTAQGFGMSITAVIVGSLVAGVVNLVDGLTYAVIGNVVLAQTVGLQRSIQNNE